MKKLILPLSLIALGFIGIASMASAQYYDARVTGPRVSVQSSRDGRAAFDIARLQREVRQVRLEIRAAGGGGRRIRYQFDRVVRATDRLTFQFRRGELRRWEVRQRADEIRSGLYRIRQELRLRSGRPRVWR